MKGCRVSQALSSLTMRVSDDNAADLALYQNDLHHRPGLEKEVACPGDCPAQRLSNRFEVLQLLR